MHEDIFGWAGKNGSRDGDTYHQACWPYFDPQVTHSEKREPNPTSCPLTFKCMSMSIHMWLCIHVSLSTHLCMHTHVPMSTHLYMHIHVPVSTYLCMHTHVPRSTHLCMHTHVAERIKMCVCVHMHTVNVINFQRIILVEKNHLIFNSYKVDLPQYFYI